jgi:hypothetical protein
VSEAAQCRPIDLEDLNRRLEAVPTSPASSKSSVIDEEEYNRYNLEQQVEYYDTLVREGGRPSHPVKLGRGIIENPGEYREILSYWQSHSGDWQVFQAQMGTWREFRRWQRKNREDGRFAKYAEDVKAGLAEHGFTRLFQLAEDQERQDKLTTWIEYLDYEYWWYDRDMRILKLRRPEYDEAWKKLVESRVLRPFETEEFICGSESVFLHVGEEERAKRAVESAKSVVQSAQKLITDREDSDFSLSQPQQRLAAAQSRLDATLETLRLIKRRNNLIVEFIEKTGKSQSVKGGLKLGYLTIKKRAEDRRKLLRWILDQVPLIELELNLGKRTQDHSTIQDGKRRPKRARSEESSDEQTSKRQRQDVEGHVVLDRGTRTAISKQCESQPVCSCHNLTMPAGTSTRCKSDGRNDSLACQTSDAAGSKPIEQLLPIKHPFADDAKDTISRTDKERVSYPCAPRETRFAAKTSTKELPRGAATSKKRRKRVGKFSNHSIWTPAPRRRSARLRQPPDRFQ